MRRLLPPVVYIVDTAGELAAPLGDLLGAAGLPVRVSDTTARFAADLYTRRVVRACDVVVVGAQGDAQTGRGGVFGLVDTLLGQGDAPGLVLLADGRSGPGPRDSFRRARVRVVEPPHRPADVLAALRAVL